MAVNNIVKRIQNIMRGDAGVNGDAQVLINTLYVTISDLQQGYSKHITMEVVK